MFIQREVEQFEDRKTGSNWLYGYRDDQVDYCGISTVSDAIKFLYFFWEINANDLTVFLIWH